MIIKVDQQPRANEYGYMDMAWQLKTGNVNFPGPLSPRTSRHSHWSLRKNNPNNDPSSRKQPIHPFQKGKAVERQGKGEVSEMQCRRHTRCNWSGLDKNINEAISPE